MHAHSTAQRRVQNEEGEGGGINLSMDACVRGGCGQSVVGQCLSRAGASGRTGGAPGDGMLGKGGSVRTVLSCRRIAGRMRLAGAAGQGPQMLAGREVQIPRSGRSHRTQICTCTSHRSVLSDP